MTEPVTLADKSSPGTSIYAEMIDLIAQGGGPASVIAFRPSEALQDRVYALVERKHDGTITGEESNLLFHYTELEHILRIAKIRARLVLQNEVPAPTAPD